MSADSGALPLREVGQIGRELEGYELRGMAHSPEDILFCVDTDRQTETEMKVAGGKGQVLTRLDAVKQALLLFVHSKLMMHPSHRFSFATIGQIPTWHQQEFCNDLEIINNSVRTLQSDGLYIGCDLSHLFRLAATEAKKSRSQGRILRLILIYCRSNVVPDFSGWTSNQPIFTFDALYLHDKPGQYNCPQVVYDALVEALEKVSEYEGYIFESGTGLPRVLFKQMCILSSHPQQRCGQDDFSAPRDLAKVVVSVETIGGSVSSKKEDDSTPYPYA